MSYKRALPEGTTQRLSILLKETKSLRDFKRIQSVYLRALLGLSVQEIARAVGYSTSYVRKIQNSYIEEGEKALLSKGRGGRYHENLTIKEEEDFLRPFMERAARETLVVREVKEAYEERVGHRVPRSTIYRLLKRHGWSKEKKEKKIP